MAGDIRRRLIEFVCDNFMVEEHEFAPDKSLVDQGVIDSFGLIVICSFMEKEFNFVVRESDMTKENFGSILNMVRYIERNMRQ